MASEKFGQIFKLKILKFRQLALTRVTFVFDSEIILYMMKIWKIKFCGIRWILQGNEIFSNKSLVVYQISPVLSFYVELLDGLTIEKRKTLRR